MKVFVKQGQYSPTILKNILCLFLQDFVNCKFKCNTTSDWLCRTRFSQSEGVLFSNAAKYTKLW